MGEALISRTSGQSIEIVQGRGTSETAVMSQKAVSENTVLGKNANGVNADSIAIGSLATSAGSSIAIGDTASATNSGVAIGLFATAENTDSVAIGRGSTTAEAGVVSVGNGSESAFYGKRRIVNVQEPKDMTDAATQRTLYGHVLFADNAGSTGDSSGIITLSTSYKSYERIGIYYFGGSNVFQSYVEFQPAVANGAVLNSTYPDSSGSSLFVRCAYCSFDTDNTCSMSRNASFKITSSGLSKADDNKIKITKIVGLIYSIYPITT